MGKNNFLKHTAIKIECYFYTQIKHLSHRQVIFLRSKEGKIMKPNEQVIKELIAERDELQDKLSKLRKFTNSETFYEKVSLSQARGLNMQEKAMDEYITALNIRIGDLTK